MWSRHKLHRKWEGQRLDYFCITLLLYYFLASRARFGLLWWAQHFLSPRLFPSGLPPQVASARFVPAIHQPPSRQRALALLVHRITRIFAKQHTIDTYGRSPQYQPGHLTCALFQCLYHSADKCSRVRVSTLGVSQRARVFSEPVFHLL